MNAPPAEAPPASPTGGARARSVWLACARDELLAPAGALVQRVEMLYADASDRGHERFLADLGRMRASGAALLGLVRELLDPAGDVPGGDWGKEVRHELRTPLSHILGYCELWLEDAAEELLEGFAGDLREIHALGARTLARLEDIVGFGSLAGRAAPGGDGLPELAREVARSLPPAGKGRPACEPGSVLVVDDNEVNRDLLARWLRREGHRVVTADDGRQALEAVRAHLFDLVLLDVIMPGLNGLQTLQRLKADAGCRDIPVLMISAFGDLDSVVPCIETGAEDYLPKPINPVLLRARISACLEKKRLRDREVYFLRQLQEERKRSDELLHVILPAEAVRELKATDAVRPRRYEEVAVLFCDVVGFTPLCDRHPPEDVVAQLQQLIEAWEGVALAHQVDKIKTVGDSFMAAAGLLRRTAEHPVLHCLRCGVEMLDAAHHLPAPWEVRVGVHLGPVVAGVIGRRQYLFDLWGDTVNTAARMESHGVPGAVVLSGPAWEPVAARCRGESLGRVEIKGKGRMEVIRFDGFLP